jgi:diguanylate cyclase (GGDEF)-like protein
MVIHNLIFWGLPTLALVINAMLFFMLAISKKDKLIISFMLYVAVMIFWSASSILMKFEFAPNVLFWSRVMTACITFVPYFAYIFISIFTSQLKKLHVLFWSIVIIALLAMHALGLTVSSAEILQLTNDAGEVYKEVAYQPGTFAYPAFAIMFILLSSSLLKMRNAFKFGVKNTKRLYPVLIGLFILYVGFALNILPAVGKYPVDFAAGIITSSLLMYAIYKEHVVELRIVVTRTLIFTTIMTILFGGVALLVNVLLDFFDQFNNGLSREIFVLLTSLITIIIFQPLFSVIHRLVDNYFYKKENHQSNLIKNFTLSASNNLNLEHLVQELLKVVYQLTNNDDVAIFFKNSQNDDYSYYASCKKLNRLNLNIRQNHPFIHWFSQFNDVIKEEYLNTHPIFKTLWEKERQELVLIRFEAAIALKYNNEIIGMLIISSKDYQTLLSNDDLNAVSTLCATAAIAMSNARMFEKFQKDAIMDSLTNLYNHRYFIEQLQKLTKDLRSQMVSLIIINIDMFALFNEIYGHYAGDIVLQKVADAIKFVNGEKGTICRYGGDVFAIILPYTDSRTAYELSERIRERVESTSMAKGDEITRNITISTGICTAPSIASDDKDLVSKATAALRYAKITGKNKSVIFNPDTHDQKVNDSASDEMNMATIYALTAAIDAKDHYTFGHSQRVAQYATAIAKEAGADKEEVEMIRQASLLHDIGKIGIPEHILTKFTRLDEEEYEIMKMHVDMSITIIKYLPSFSHVIPAVVGHHERWDGSGYPRRIKGESIPFAARCIAVADAFDAITSNRHYKTHLSIDYALDEVESNAGKQFDPILAKIFVKLVRSGELIIEPSRSTTNPAQMNLYQ